MSVRDPAAWMWAEACEMLDRADRLHRQFFRLGRETNRGASWEPPVDIFETATDLAVMVALPGWNLAISACGSMAIRCS